MCIFSNKRKEQQLVFDFINWGTKLQLLDKNITLNIFSSFFLVWLENMNSICYIYGKYGK